MVGRGGTGEREWGTGSVRGTECSRGWGECDKEGDWGQGWSEKALLRRRLLWVESHPLQTYIEALSPSTPVCDWRQGL